MPSRRVFHPAMWSRAAFSPTMLAIAPPDTSRPAASSPMPNRAANHRTRFCSISLAEGESCHPPTFMLTPDASMSTTAPGTVPLPVT